jgi:hypothetical protein
MTTTRRLAISRVLAALSIWASLTSSGCHDVPEPVAPSGPSHPAVLIGIDGLEWSTVLTLVRAGRMPTLAGLIERGSAGELVVTKPTLSPILWTSIATGVGSKKHGIRGFVRGKQAMKDESGRAATLNTSNERRVKAFWNILTDANRRVHTIGWWLTYPVEKINGVMVAQVNTVTPAMRRAGQGIWKGTLVEGLAGQVHPPKRESEILALVPRVDAGSAGLVRAIFGDLPGERFPGPARMMEESLWAFRADSLYHRIALDVLAKDGPFDALAIYLGGADVIGHRFWRHAYPDDYRFAPDSDEHAAYGKVLEDYYAYLDGVVGSLVDAAPSDANILVVGDHGMTAIRRANRFRKPALSGGHLGGPPAVLIASGPDIRTAEALPADSRPPTLGSILDVAPTLLALADVPVGRDMDGEPITAILRPEFLRDHPIGAVARHTESGWYENRPKPVADDSGNSERLEQLRALGYLAD